MGKRSRKRKSKVTESVEEEDLGEVDDEEDLIAFGSLIVGSKLLGCIRDKLLKKAFVKNVFLDVESDSGIICGASEDKDFFQFPESFGSFRASILNGKGTIVDFQKECLCEECSSAWKCILFIDTDPL